MFEKSEDLTSPDPQSHIEHQSAGQPWVSDTPPPAPRLPLCAQHSEVPSPSGSHKQRDWRSGGSGDRGLS